MDSRIIKIVSGALLFVSTAFASSTGSCWSVEDKADLEFSELQQTIKFSFKDAKTCENISNAKVYFAGQEMRTDSFGEISLPTPPEHIDGKFPLIVKKDGYISLKQKVQASVGSFWQNKFLMTKELPISSARFVLSWGDKPRDLDLHLVSDDFHISFRNKNGAAYKAKLDRDSMRGFGPETITLNHLERLKSYNIYIHRYSRKGKIDNRTNLSLYKNNRLDRVVNIPRDMESRCVQVASIYNNQVSYNIKEVNEKKCKKR